MCRTQCCRYRSEYKHDEKSSGIAFHRNSISQLHRTLICTLLNIMSMSIFFPVFFAFPFSFMFAVRCFRYPHRFEVVCIFIANVIFYTMLNRFSSFFIARKERKKMPLFSVAFFRTCSWSDRKEKKMNLNCALI